jgi:hypothetical protein
MLCERLTSTNSPARNGVPVGVKVTVWLLFENES